MKFTRPKLHSDVRYAHAEVLLSLINQVLEMPSSADGSETSVGSGSCLNQELLPLNLKARLSSYHWTRAECGLGQFVGDDVVTDHLPTSSLMSFQLALVIAAHL